MNPRKIMYALSHAPISAHFSKSADDFVVREIPLYDFSNNGEWAYLHIQKKGLSTSEAIKILSAKIGAKGRDFGYAGLKDKQGLTTQYICIHKKFIPQIEKIQDLKDLKILDISYHNNKLKTGHLKGNKFFIRLKKVLPAAAIQIEQALNNINIHGFANYFGYQRFGKDGNNAQTGLKILQEVQKFKNRKINDFLISAFQSELFNMWLSKRVEISKFADEFSENELVQIYSKEFSSFDKNISNMLKSQKTLFKLLPGEILGHYPHGKIFLCENLDLETERFYNKNITSCGLLLGKRTLNSSIIAKEIENTVFKEFEQTAANINGNRRFAWSWIENLDYKYIPEKAHFQINFTLQKGSYATVVLEEILHKNIFE